MHHVHIAMYCQMLQLSISSPEWEYVFVLLLFLQFQNDNNLQRARKIHQNQHPIIFGPNWNSKNHFLCKLKPFGPNLHTIFQTPPLLPPILTGCCSLNVHNQGIITVNNAPNTIYKFIQHMKFLVIWISIEHNCLILSNMYTDICIYILLWLNWWHAFLPEYLFIKNVIAYLSSLSLITKIE